jgi:hypothetical protein
LKITTNRRQRVGAGVRTSTAAGVAVVMIALINGCASTRPPPATNPIASPETGDAHPTMLHAPNAAIPAHAASKPPRLSVGTSFPDTQLILPWFLNDIINFVNYR